MVAAGQAAYSRAVPAASTELRATPTLMHLEELDRVRHSLDLLWAKAGGLELASQQPVGGLAANELAGRGNVLQSDGHVSRFPHQRDRILLCLDDGQTGMEPNPRDLAPPCVRVGADPRAPSCH